MWVRGGLGPLTIWATDGGHEGRQEAKHLWTKLYSETHRPSPHRLVKLELDTPLTLLPGQLVGIYVHSSRPDDQAIVYDNERNRFIHSLDIYLN